MIVYLSGGKDSLRCLTEVLDQGVPLDRIECWHHRIDGAAGQSTLMDWPVTPDYCRRLCSALGVAYYESYRDGGFETELLKAEAQSRPIHFETPDGWRSGGGTRSAISTRRKFPQKTANLSQRWCSGQLKIDVAALAIRNQPRFVGQKVLTVSGERAEESAARAKYKGFEPDRTDLRSGRKPRLVDRWRPLIHTAEKAVWAGLEQYGIQPHPCYRIGFSRCSCQFCIFGNKDQWATLRYIDPDRFSRIASYETEFGFTIDRVWNVHQMADQGAVYPAAIERPDLVRLALSEKYTADALTDSWQMPAGAFGHSEGPS